MPNLFAKNSGSYLLIIALFQIVACGGGGGDGGGGQEPPTLIAPSLTNASAQALISNEPMTTLSFSNSGGGSLSSCEADSLPIGLSVNVSSANSTCEISGTPTSEQSDSLHSVTATNSSGSSTASVNIVVVGTPVLRNVEDKTYLLNETIDTLSIETSGISPILSCSADSLPEGLVVNVSETGLACELSGTPTVVQTPTAHTIEAENEAGTNSTTVEVAVVNPPSLQDIEPQSFNKDEQIEVVSFNNTGGLLNSCEADILPAGLVVSLSTDNSTCEISGTPTELQSETIHTVTAVNAGGVSSASISITVQAPPSLTNLAAQVFVIKDQIASLSFPNSGGGNLIECTSTSLPTGLMVSASDDLSTCEITGTPTEVTPQATYTVTAVNLLGSSEASVDLTIRDERKFITTWDTEEFGITESDQIMITTFGDGYNYTVEWGDGTSDENVTGDITHTYDVAGIYTVEISGDFPQIYFESALESDSWKILTVEQWGDGNWRSMNRAFNHCFSMALNAPDIPDLTLVTDFTRMFNGVSAINSDLSQWDVSKVTSMNRMFTSVRVFNQDLSSWDVSSVTDMELMFAGEMEFTNDLSSWDTSSVTNMRGMFWGVPNFNQPIGNWDVSSVTNMSVMFAGTDFNSDISNWDVSSVTDMSAMFDDAETFNIDVSQWDVSSVTDMSQMFESTDSFNQNISNWNISSVTDMSNMFAYALAFNQSINNWDVSSVTTMSGMFLGAEVFNQDISNWNVSSVTDMSSMFSSTSKFNQSVNSWDVSSVTDISSMFENTIDFNQNLNSWDVSSVVNMSRLFKGAVSFNNDISAWNVASVTDMNNMFSGSVLFDQDISAWDVSSVTDMSQMFEGAEAFNQLIGGWDVSAVETMVSMFSGNQAFSQDLDGWNISNVADLSYMFSESIFNGSVGDWDTSSVTNMNSMFKDNVAFNQPIGGWDIALVTDVASMFEGASTFNQPLSDWDISSVTRISQMFNGATSFDQDIGAWNISSITFMFNILNNSGLSTANYDLLLIGWSAQSPQSGVEFDAGTTTYSSSAQSARNTLTDNYNWRIDDGGLEL